MSEHLSAPALRVSAWLSRFGAALDSANPSVAAEMFHEESYWRDLVSFTWNITTAEGKDSIKAMLDATVPATKPGNWQSEEMCIRDRARKEGVIFDVGHGCGSFCWDVARRSFEYDFYPDTISTDLHRYSIGRWAIDMPTTMSKFLHLGMTLDDVILKATWQPAKAIGRGQQLGTLRIGTVADILVFELEQGEFLFEDTHLKIEKASRRIKPALVIKAGQTTNPSEAPKNLRRLYDCDYELLKLVEETAN